MSRAIHDLRLSHFLSLVTIWLVIGRVMMAPSSLYATHNVAGQIAAVKVDPDDPTSRTYRITLTTYTDPAPAGVDRCSADILIFDRGSGATTPLDILAEIPRANGPAMTGIPNGDCTIAAAGNGVPVRGSIKENLYIVEYTFPGAGTYDLIYSDVARIDAVDNICDPTSQPFTVLTTVSVLPPLANGNSSIVLLNEPLDDACVGEIWTHQPGAWDEDGDSLSYEIVGSMVFNPDEAYSLANGNPGVPACYLFPDDPTFEDPAFGIPSILTVDPVTGLMTWDFPQRAGIFNVGIIIYEWRNGEIIGFVRRDMAIFVDENCDNRRPVIETLTDTCVYAGDELFLDFLAYDPDSTDSLYLDLNNGSFGDNGPFIVDNPASLTGDIVDLSFGSPTLTPYTDLPQATNNADNLPETSEPDTIKGTIVWQTVCDNIRRQHYQVDFYATDNKRYSNPGVPNKQTLATYQSVTIRVIPPPPTNLRVARDGSQIRLDWEPPFCTDLLKEYNIYRRADGGELAQDTTCCEETPISAGYQLIATVGPEEVSFFDPLENVTGGLGDSLCYAVTAVFTERENEFPTPDDPESCAADDCIDLDTDPIYLTNDSIGIDYTDPVNGQVFLSWSQPNIDPIFPAPYTFRLYRANNDGFPAIEVARLSYEDTTYLDAGIDTESRGYNYRVEIFDANDRRIEASDGSNIGTTIFLEVMGSGTGIIDLTWTETIPWTNSQYEIFRADNGGPFQLLTTVPGTGLRVHRLRDSALNPNWEYCYYVRATGSWGLEEIKDPLINDSQVACDFAQDDEAPCPPDVIATGDCNNDIHQVLLTKSDQDCDGDASFLILEYALTPESPFREIDRIDYNSFDTTLTLEVDGTRRDGNRSGCYAVRAVDSLGNISERSLLNCVDYCPAFLMSNVFTPNQDGFNDILHPKERRDIQLVNFQIFDRYGRLMHETQTDINDLWDGLTPRGEPAPEGVYFYLIEYQELSLFGEQPIQLEKGTVTLLR